MSEETLGRLLTAWSTPDAEDRTEILDDCISASGFYYCDPHLPDPAGDRAAFEDFLTKFTSALPDAEIQTGAALTHHTHALMAFRLFARDQMMGAGHYAASFDAEGRVTRLVGFME